jgi:hypothetical protein
MLTFGKPEPYVKEIKAALGLTLWFSSFVPETEGGPPADELRQLWDGRPVIYAVTYMNGSPPSHPELERLAGGPHGGGYLYIGRTGNAWRRFSDHRATLEKVCWPGGPELERFWYFAIPVEEEWQTHSFERLAITALNPLFNDLLTGFGAGGEGDFMLYLSNPSGLSDTDRHKREELVERVIDAVDDPKQRPLTWFDEPPKIDPVVMAWLEGKRRDV